MAKSVLDIVIRTLKDGGGDKDVVKGLVSIKSNVMQAGRAFAAFAGIAYTVDKALDATAGKYVAYGQNVRDASLALGLSADETSRVIAMTDDLGISYDELSASIKKNADNTNYSIEGLASASTQYLALGNAQDRASFAQEKYGKQWTQFQKLLEQGPDAVREMAASIDDAHLFNEADLKRIEDYRVATDQMNDSIEGLSMAMGEKAVPALTKLIQGMTIYINLASHQEETYARAAVYRNAVEMAIEKETKALVRSTDTWYLEDEAMRKTSETAEILAVDYDKLIGSIQAMQSETDRYNETQQSANDAISQANSDLAAGNISVEQHTAILEDNRTKLDENAEAHKKWAAQTVFAFATARAAVDGTTSAEGQMLIDIGVQLGLFDQQTADTMTAVNSAFDGVDTENAQQVIEAVRQQLESLTGQEWRINITTSAPTSMQTDAPLTPYATGGAFDAGAPMLVHQDEIMVPDYGGVVLTRTDAMRLLSGEGGANNSRSITIYGLTINAKGASVMDILEELS